MALTWEQQAINVAVSKRSIRPFISAGIRPDWFQDFDHRAVWQYLVDYWQEYGEGADRSMLGANFPDYDYTRPAYSTQAVIDRALAHRKRFVVTAGMADAQIALTEDRLDDVLELVGAMQADAIRETTHSDNTDLATNTADRLEYYTALAEDPEVGGIPTGFPTIDKIIGGMRPKQFIVLTAEPKTGKSWFSLLMAMHAHSLGRSVLYITFEMTEHEQWVRHDAVLAGVDSDGMLRGALTPVERKRLEVHLERFAERETAFHVINNPDLNTVPALRAKIEEHQVDLVVVDGMYFLQAEGFAPRDQGSPQAYTQISRAMKVLAQRTNIPVIGTTQTLEAKTRSGRITLGSPGYSSAWGQDADVMIGVEKLDDDDDARRLLRVVGGRTTGTGEVVISTDWKRSTFEEVDDGLGPDDAQSEAARGRPDRS